MHTLDTENFDVTHCWLTGPYNPYPGYVSFRRWTFFVGRRSFFLWQPTIIGSQCQLVLSHWLLSFLQTNDLSKFWLGHSS